jgi:hypothetical protein
VEKIELKISGMYWVCSSLHNWKFLNEAHQEERATNRQNNTSGSGVIAQCCAGSETRT